MFSKLPWGGGCQEPCTSFLWGGEEATFQQFFIWNTLLYTLPRHEFLVRGEPSFLCIFCVLMIAKHFWTRTWIPSAIHGEPIEILAFFVGYLYIYTRHFESSFRLTKLHLNLRKSIFIYGVWRSGAIASVEVEADFLALHNLKINVGREYWVLHNVQVM